MARITNEDLPKARCCWNLDRCGWQVTLCEEYSGYWVRVFPKILGKCIFKNIGFVYSRKYWVGVFPKVLGISISLESWVLNTQCCALKGKHVLMSGIQAWVECCTLGIHFEYRVMCVILYCVCVGKTEEDIVISIQKAFSLSSSQSLFVPPGNPDNYCNSPHSADQNGQNRIQSNNT